MPRGDAPGADRGDNETADEEDQEGPGQPACPFDERNHEEWSVARHDTIDVTLSELRNPTARRPIARGSRSGAAATTALRSVRGPRRRSPEPGFFESVRAIGAGAPTRSCTHSLRFVKTMPQMFQCA